MSTAPNAFNSISDRYNVLRLESTDDTYGAVCEYIGKMQAHTPSTQWFHANVENYFSGCTGTLVGRATIVVCYNKIR